jgi:predicted RNA binding protein YcfA (HicA-like mRNA interferase family)
VYYNEASGRRVTVPFHRGDVPIGTLLAILKASGIPRDEWKP